MQSPRSASGALASLPNRRLDISVTDVARSTPSAFDRQAEDIAADAAAMASASVADTSEAFGLTPNAVAAVSSAESSACERFLGADAKPPSLTASSSTSLWNGAVSSRRRLSIYVGFGVPGQWQFAIVRDC